MVLRGSKLKFHQFFASTDLFATHLWTYIFSTVHRRWGIVKILCQFHTFLVILWSQLLQCEALVKSVIFLCFTFLNCVDKIWTTRESQRRWPEFSWQNFLLIGTHWLAVLQVTAFCNLQTLLWNENMGFQSIRASFWVSKTVIPLAFNPLMPGDNKKVTHT